MKKLRFIIFASIFFLNLNTTINPNNSLKRCSFFNYNSTELNPIFKNLMDQRAKQYAFYAFKKHIKENDPKDVQVILGEKIFNFLQELKKLQLDTILNNEEIKIIVLYLLKKVFYEYLEVFSDCICN